MRTFVQNVVVFTIFALVLETSSTSTISAVFTKCKFLQEFDCGDGTCIARAEVCDGKSHCKDKSDEVECEQCPPSNWFRCHDKTCISKLFVCDGLENCPDGSDEFICEHTSSGKDCNGKFKCANGECISSDDVCNGEPDCGDESDEMDCSNNSTVHCSEFMCKNGHCLVDIFKCDGDDDCGDNSDEEDCGITVSTDCNLNNGLYRCKDNSSCIAAEKVCNHNPDCKDKSDEGGLCTNTQEHCLNANCSHGCIITPDGPFCACPRGYGRITNTSCDDMDECHLLHGHCSQHCKNLPGSYTCYCDEGYELMSDGRSCKAKGGEAVMVFATDAEIRAFNIKERKYYIVSKEAHQPIGVVYDGTHVYWTESRTGYEAIYRSYLNGSDQEVIVNTGMGIVEDISIDWYTGNIYFTDNELKHIGVCSNDGVHCSVLITKHIDKPRAIVLNPIKGEMYWTDWGTKPEIARSNMDGSDDISLVSDDIKWPNGLTIDYSNNRLYWVDARMSRIESVRLDGTHRKRILQNIHHPFWISVFEDNLYWNDWKKENMQVCNKFTGKERKILLSGARLHGIHIYHPSLVVKKKHACESNSCTHLCLLKGNNSYTCGCPEGKELSNDKKSCIGYTKEMFLVIVTGDTLLTLHHQFLGRHNIFKKTFNGMDFDEIVYDSLNHRVIVYDILSSTIYAIERFDQKNSILKVLANSDIIRIEGMDLDYITNTLYWCDPPKGTLEVMSLFTLERTVLMKVEDGEAIIDVVLVPEQGLMFVAIRTHAGYIHINRIGMDGKGTSINIIEHGIRGPMVKMHYDPEHYLIYIADIGGKKIETIHIEGTGRRNFGEISFNPASMTMLGRDIFWTKPHSNRLYWAKIENTQVKIRNNKLDSVSGPVKLMHLAAVVTPKINTAGKNHECAKIKNACSHICVQSQAQTLLRPSDTAASMYTCLCPPHMVMSSDRKTCESQVECNANQFQCERSNVCVDKSRVCDGKMDCSKGEDEESCTVLTKPCLKEQFKCSDGQCIGRQNRCDKHDDCDDKSDEENCENYDPHKECKSNEYECKSGRCINNSTVCDGSNDCQDGDDELHCGIYRCKDTLFQCHFGNCIPKEWECDKSLDCIDGSDEHNNCSYNLPCESGMFRCRSGGCVDVTSVCNGMSDCADDSDEEGCPEVEEIASCGIHETTCESDPKICIPYDAKCNGTKECPQGEDEIGCKNTNEKCGDYQWRCHGGGGCIPESFKCDKRPDCPDGSDELKENCEQQNDTATHQKFPSTLAPMSCVGGYNCTSSGQCIDYKDLCDKIPNCIDGSDEGGACDTSCRGNICEDICIPSPRGGICTCTNRKTLAADGHTCNPPPPPCLADPPPCQHICIDKNKSYSCSCFEGYTLRADRRSCKANGNKMTIFYINGGDIRMLSTLNFSVKVIHKENSPQLTGLDVHNRKQFVFFSVETQGEVHRLDLRTGQDTVLSNMQYPTLVAVDWITGNLYVVNDGKCILVCQMDKQKCSKIKTFQSGTITALVVDPINKLLFCSLTRWPARSEIYKIYLDGTREEVLVNSSLSLCKGLAIDYERKLLYFSDKQNNRIDRIFYEGTHRQQVLSGNVYVEKPVDLDVFEDEIYFMVGSSRKMTRCRLTGEHRCLPFSVNAYGVEHFALAQSSKQKSVEDECATANCSHVCVLVPKGAKCICPNGGFVAEHTVCLNDETQDNYEFKTESRYEVNSSNVKKGSGNRALVAIVIVFTISILACGIYILYKYQKKNIKKATNPDISVHFQNPTFAGDAPNFAMSLGSITSKFPSLLRLNQNEYVNPLHSKLISNSWATNSINTNTMKKTSGNQLEVPKLLADSDSDVESDRDLHDGDHRDKSRLIP